MTTSKISWGGEGISFTGLLPRILGSASPVLLDLLNYVIVDSILGQYLSLRRKLSPLANRPFHFKKGAQSPKAFICFSSHRKKTKPL